MIVGGSLVITADFEAPSSLTGPPVKGEILSGIDPLLATALEAQAALSDDSDGVLVKKYLNPAALQNLTELEYRLIRYRDWIANDGITPAQVLDTNLFADLDTDDDPCCSYYYMVELFNFAYEYFRVSDERRAQMKYDIHRVHRIALYGAAAEAERTGQGLSTRLGHTAISPQ